MKITSINFSEKEQIWQDEQTRYWFNVEFVNDDDEACEQMFAVVESGPDSFIVDENGSDILLPKGSDRELLKASLMALVTDKMRLDF